VLVAAVDETRRDALKSAKTMLDGTGARLLGVAANKVPSSGSGAYYYDGYYGEASNGAGKQSFAMRLFGRFRRTPASHSSAG
jgi:Mrp family chromosome partitioning ATPase